jgi:hypothetical protein
MSISKDKRKKVEQKVIETMRLLDPTGKNAEKYKKLFAGMSDTQFETYFKRMKNDDNNNFYVEMDLYSEKPVSMETIQAAASYLKVPLEEYVYIRHFSPDGTPIRSKFRVPVMYIHLKRMQQILSKKNRSNIDIMKSGARSKLTGSLSDRERTGRLTDADTLALLAATNNSIDPYSMSANVRNAVYGEEADNYIIKEILGARADNLNQKFDMQMEISNLGTTYVSKYMNKNIHAGQALNTLDIFLVGAGLKSNLITGGLMTKQGLAAKVTELENK